MKHFGRWLFVAYTILAGAAWGLSYTSYHFFIPTFMAFIVGSAGMLAFLGGYPVSKYDFEDDP
jgi:ABC-type xylose transport system permease subunit